MQRLPDEITNKWGLTPLFQVADTGQACVWKVATTEGTFRALKLYQRADRGNEAPGSRLLRAWQDRGAVGIVKEEETAVLMEWLDGPSLSDMARNGTPEQAVTLLAETARQLHHQPQVSVTGLKPLKQVLAPLFTLRFSESCPAPFKQDLRRAVDLAQALLDRQKQTTILHGDLHPDNIILTDAGPRVIDAKGYFGDRAFELANALRHPKGMPDLVRRPDQITRCLVLYATAMEVDEKRLAQWAAAKCALSIFWRSDGQVTNDDEADLLHQLLRVAD